MDFLWHNLSEKDKEEIKKQVGSILESFSKKLEKIEGTIIERGIERDECTRKELNIEKEKKELFLIDAMLKNAPNKDDNFIIAEKKKW